MTAGTYPDNAIPELTDSQIKDIIAGLDVSLNDVILTAFLYVAITLWAVASRNKSQNSRRPCFLVFIIALLYFQATFNFYDEWALNFRNFITTNEWQTFESFRVPAPVHLTSDIGAILSTILVDATLIWRCWIVWGRSWCVVLVPIACTALGTASRGIVAYFSVFGPDLPPGALFLENIVSWSVLYSSLVLATLLWCTILIIYRIWKVGAAAGRMYAYQRVIEMLVESAFLYSAVLVVLLVFEVRNEVAGVYIEDLAIATRGIVPTILVGRVAAGHARPDDSWTGSTVSSLQFRSRTSAQDDSDRSAGWAISTGRGLGGRSNVGMIVPTR
ncbi:hypothetical protein IW262DRAFT_1417145 [Armillaria fumosa]|nr:hypothetical protein IW262DRAFT_1417145 [Armillaria fumosa]